MSLWLSESNYTLLHSKRDKRMAPWVIFKGKQPFYFKFYHETLKSGPTLGHGKINANSIGQFFQFSNYCEQAISMANKFVSESSYTPLDGSHSKREKMNISLRNL